MGRRSSVSPAAREPRHGVPAAATDLSSWHPGLRHAPALESPGTQPAGRPSLPSAALASPPPPVVGDATRHRPVAWSDVPPSTPLPPPTSAASQAHVASYRRQDHRGSGAPTPSQAPHLQAPRPRQTLTFAVAGRDPPLGDQPQGAPRFPTQAHAASGASPGSGARRQGSRPANGGRRGRGGRGGKGAPDAPDAP